MLEIKNLSKKFGSRTIFKDLSVEIPDGTILTVVGESGGGKTTFLRILSGLETMDAGTITLDGKEIDPTSANNTDQIGVVFQDFQLFPHMNVLENITLAPVLSKLMTKEEANKSAEQLLTKLDLADKKALYPYQLSGGQKQRVAIARALAMKPKVLAYDEPTSALDPGLRKQVEELILSLKDTGVTQIVVTHDWDFAEAISDEKLEVVANKAQD